MNDTIKYVAIVLISALGLLFGVTSQAATQSGVSGWHAKKPPMTTPWTDKVSPRNDHSKYPRPQMVRRHWKSLNGVWQFAAAKKNETPPVGKALSERILVPFPVESALSGIMRHESRMFYRRKFSVPRRWHVTQAGCLQSKPQPSDGNNQRHCQHLLLHFGAVDWHAQVWVNGHSVGAHQGGYNGFTFDITSALKPQGKQELIVGVYDPTENGGQPLGKQRNAAFHDPSGIFYTPTSGIWQTVWMEPVPRAHIERLDMTPDLHHGTLKLTVHAANAHSETVKAIAYAGKKQVGSIVGPANQTLNLQIPHPKLWAPSHPFLYHLKVRLLNKSSSNGAAGQRQNKNQPRAVDTVNSYFGMRSIGINKIKGAMRIVLNGKFIFAFGTLDQGFWPDGVYTAPTDAALKYDLQKQKQLGYNMVRKHVKVEPQRWYYYADKLGLLVWQDMPAMPTDKKPSAAAKKEFVKELHRMIEQHGSHPSIVTWVPFNEGWGEFEPKRVTHLIKQWDPSRLVDSESGTNCCHSLGVNTGDIKDNHTYVGPGTPAPSDQRATIDGEYGGFGLKVNGHEFAPEKSHAYEMEPTSKKLTDRYVALGMKLEQLEKRCGLSGAIYTQTTDVETEINGLLTYDRKIFKMNAQRISEINRKIIAASKDIQSISAKRDARCGQQISKSGSSH